MTSVWVVTNGEYSDFQVIAICATQELADVIRDRIASENDIEEWVVLDAVPEHYNLPPLWRVEMVLADGSRAVARRAGEGIIEEIGEYEFKGMNLYWGENRKLQGEPAYVCALRADTVERAIKAANEKRIAFKLKKNIP